MLGKRRQETGVRLWEAARAICAAARQGRSAADESSRPLPVGHSEMASPRACLTSALRRDMGDTDTLMGARRVWTEEIMDAWCDRASASPRASQRLGRCRICQDTDGNRADGKRGAGFAREDESGDGMRGSEEVVPQRSTAVGTDWTHDVLRDSGAAAWAGPGASFSRSGGGFSGGSNLALENQEACRDWQKPCV